MTTAEISFYEKTIALLNQAIPHRNFSDWLLESHTEKTFYPHIAVHRAENTGHYSYDYELMFRKPVEKINPIIDSLANTLAGTTDEKVLQDFGRKMREVTLDSEMRIRISVNQEYTAVTDCQGAPLYPRFMNQDHGWGVDIPYAAQVQASGNDDVYCKNATCVLMGMANPFQFYKFDTGEGGNVVSEVKLPIEKGEQAFCIYNIVIAVEANQNEAQQFLSLIDWNLLAAHMTNPNPKK